MSTYHSSQSQGTPSWQWVTRWDRFTCISIHVGIVASQEPRSTWTTQSSPFLPHKSERSDSLGHKHWWQNSVWGLPWRETRENEVNDVICPKWSGHWFASTTETCYQGAALGNHLELWLLPQTGASLGFYHVLSLCNNVRRCVILYCSHTRWTTGQNGSVNIDLLWKITFTWSCLLLLLLSIPPYSFSRGSLA